MTDRKPSRNYVRAVCACAPRRLIRASRTVLQGPPIVCGACGSPFRAAAEETGA